MAKTLPIKARLVTEFIVEVTNIPIGPGGKTVWRAPLVRFGRALQDSIAESFAGERVAGSSQLARNTQAWNQRKAEKGLDPRRGHATNRLQRALDGKPLFRVRHIVVNKKGLGRVRVEFIEAWLHQRVPYAEYYEEKKVRRRGILAVARQWVDVELRILQAFATEEALRERRAQRRSTNPRKVAIASRLAPIRRLRG